VTIRRRQNPLNTAPIAAEHRLVGRPNWMLIEARNKIERIAKKRFAGLSARFD